MCVCTIQLPLHHSPKEGLCQDDCNEQSTAEEQEQNTHALSTPLLTLDSGVELGISLLDILSHRLDVVIDSIEKCTLINDERVEVLKEFGQLDDGFCDLVDFSGALVDECVVVVV